MTTLLEEVKISLFQIINYINVPDIQEIVFTTQKILNLLVVLISAQGSLFETKKQELINLLSEIKSKMLCIQSLI